MPASYLRAARGAARPALAAARSRRDRFPRSTRILGGSSSVLTCMADPSTDPEIQELTATVTRSGRRFLEVYEPLRPVLYRFCRYLSRSPWDAEDLVQDTLARAFATLGGLSEPPRDRRAWLFCVASNLWIDQVRRRDVRSTGTEAAEAGAAPRAAAGAAAGAAIDADRDRTAGPWSRDTREAAGT